MARPILLPTLDERYTWAARYVERNPVRAKMIRKAEQYPWSSAAGHGDLKTDTLITKKPVWQEQFQAIGAWSEWLAESDETEELNILRRNIDKGLPCGKDTFISNLERLAGRSLIFKPQGRPRKDKLG